SVQPPDAMVRVGHWRHRCRWRGTAQLSEGVHPVKVNVYYLSAGRRDGAPPPCALRIATTEGVFWLAQDGEAARLIRLPQPGDGEVDVGHEDGAWTTCATLALNAETEAASR